MTSGLNVIEMLVVLRQQCNLAGSQTRWADQHGISQSHINRVLRGERPFSPKLLKAMGYRRTVIFVPWP